MLASRARAFGLLRGITRLSMAPKRRAAARKAAPVAAAKKPKPADDPQSDPTYTRPTPTPEEVAELTRKYGPTQHPDEYYDTRKTDPNRPAIAQAAKAKALVEETASDDPTLANFLTWCTMRGFELHPSLVVKNASGGGDAPRHNAVFARGDIAPGDVLVVIPKCWCLTPRTGSITNVLPRDVLADLDEAALILTVMYERALGSRSPWAPYFALLPGESENLPFLWDERDAARWLEGTEVFRRIAEDLPAMRADHARCMAACRKFEGRMTEFFPDGKAPPRIAVPVPEREDDDGSSSDDDDDLGERFTEPDDGPYGFRAFLSAASLVASRAFQVDAVSGQGLVPIADLFNHRGAASGGEHVHFTEHGDEDESSQDDSDSGSDGDGDGSNPRGNPDEETVPGTDWPRRPNDAWERPNEPMPAVYPDNETYDKDLSSKPIWERSVAPACGDVTTIDGPPLTLVAVAGANAGDEIFNTFGDHGNALLLHKYGFCEWDNAHGGVTISHETLFKVLGPEVVVEAEAALDGDTEMDTEAEAEQSHEGIGFGPQKLPWERTDDATSKGAAMARAAGWVGSQYEISASGEPSRDLILLLVTALADPDDPAQMDPATGLSPRMGEDDASIVRTLDGVAEALLAVVKARREELPEGGTADGDLAAAKLAHEKAKKSYGNNGTNDAAKSGCVGEAAALLLRSQERVVLEKGMMWVIETLRAAGGGADPDVPTRTDSPGLAQPIQSTPYGSVVYLPRRGPKAATGMDKAYEKPASPNHPHPGLGSDVFGLPDPGEREDEQ